MSNRRTEYLVRQVRRWDRYGEDWLAEVPSPIDYGRPVRVFVKRRIRDQRTFHSHYVSTLTLPAKSQFLHLYDARGGAEIEQFRNDKSGLALAARRKASFIGQQAFIALTDLAHNLLAHFRAHALVNSSLADFGPQRIVRDLLNIPGRLVFDGNHLQRIELLSQKQFSQELLFCLEKYISGSFSE